VSGLTLPQQFGLWKWLSDQLTAFRKDDLLTQAEKEMPAGARMPVMYGGKLAGWVTMPEPSKTAAYISDEARLLAWTRVHYPEKIENYVEVKVDAGLIEFLQEHRPESLHVTERADRQWANDICHALASDDGYYITLQGEKLTEVPGIEVPERKPSVPAVKLGRDATAVISAAWPEIQGAFGDVLALPAGEGEAPHAA
jgi:hypothetical protein